MKKIRWGIVGPGVIANKFAKAIKNAKWNLHTERKIIRKYII